VLIPPPTVTRSRHQNIQANSTNTAALPQDAWEREQQGCMEDERMASHMERGGRKLIDKTDTQTKVRKESMG